jgi:hypothetical protein
LRDDREPEASCEFADEGRREHGREHDEKRGNVNVHAVP